MQTNTVHRTKAERQGHIEAWHQSGLSKREYCKEHEINFMTFYSWFKKPKQQNSKPAEQKFIPVEVTAADTCASAFATLTFSNELTLELHREVSAQFLKHLIACK